MGAYQKCRTCEEYVWTADRIPHKCAPLWSLWCPQWNGADSYTARGLDEEFAAMAWAEKHNDEGQLTDKSIMVCVARPGCEPSEGRWLRVSGELTIRYDADEEEPSADDLERLKS